MIFCVALNTETHSLSFFRAELPLIDRLMRRDVRTVVFRGLIIP